MSLQYIFGGSGAGKSTYLYNSIIKESIKNPLENYIIVVPEQYTMATQKRVVELHPRKGVLNIDVVSFERLAYKVFEEVGAADYPVLDDTGKNLIVRRVLEQNKKALRFFGSNISNTGFVSELKSVISEMLQYDISVDKLLDINKNVDNNSLLGMKLDDISLIYGGFREFIKNNYITSEEILDLMCRKVTESSKIRGSVIAFDGFTGFTPVQYRLMAILLDMCKEVKVALTIDISEHVNINEGIESLFYMTKDTVAHLNRICDEGHINVDKVTVGEDTVLTRFAASKELAFLEKNIFRPGLRYYSGKVNDIVMYAGITPKDEIQYVSGEILKLTRLQGFRYNEIAVVTGDISVYGKLAANIFAQNDIPYFLDQKLHEAKQILIERFDWICSQSPASAKFMWDNGVLSGYDGVDIRSAMKHGTLAIGMLGMAETLQILIGKNQLDPYGVEVAKEICQLYKDRCAEFKAETSLNFGVYYTPEHNKYCLWGLAQ